MTRLTRQKEMLKDSKAQMHSITRRNVLAGMAGLGLSGVSAAGAYDTSRYPQPFLAPGVSWKYDVIGQFDPSPNYLALDLVNALAWSPDGARIAIGSHHNDYYQLWDVQERRRLWEFKGSSSLNPTKDVAFTKDGQLVVVPHIAGGQSRDQLSTLAVLDAASGKLTQQVPAGIPDDFKDILFTSGFAISPDGKYLVASFGRHPRTFAVYDTKTWMPLHIISSPGGNQRHFLFDPVTGYLAVNSGSYRSKLHNLDSSVISNAPRDPDRTGLELWNLEQARLVRFIPEAGGTISYISNTANVIVRHQKVNIIENLGKLATYQVFENLIIFDTVEARPIKAFQGDVSRIEQLSVSIDGALVGAASGLGGVKIWDCGTGEPLIATKWWLNPLDGLSVNVFAFSPVDRRFAFGQDNQFLIGEIQRS
ncbi:MAG: WD40 repeat domain-containing protein [Rhodomicrobium sp.]